jgi:catechol 2,3-dioxygenase-like lactoylglutathione lyase family enzyme
LNRSGTSREEVIYLRYGDQGLRPADGGKHHYYDVGIEHLAFYVDRREEVDAAYQRCLDIGARIHFPPEDDRDIEGYYELFVFDPDGIRIEVGYGPPEESS